MADDIGELLYKLANQAPENTNLRETPMRYMDQSSRYAGTPPAEWDAWGGVDPDLANLVYIDKSDNDWMKTLAHEGSHSKQLIANKRKALPELSQDLIDNIAVMLETNPKFLREYLGHSSDQREFKDINNLKELLSREEVTARLKAIEAMSPKGQMLEKSPYASDLFHGEDDIENYLSATIPEGYLRNNQSKTFRKIPNQTTANPNKGVLEMLKGLLK